MTVRRAADGTIELDGICPIEDAELLQRHLLGDPRATVDWRSCVQAHASVIQVLMAYRAVLRGPPDDEFLRMHIEPLLNMRPG
ncbi:MAG TPA: hypothetical protein VF460_03270 [Burkholderiales bacterium]